MRHKKSISLSIFLCFFCQCALLSPTRRTGLETPRTLNKGECSIALNGAIYAEMPEVAERMYRHLQAIAKAGIREGTEIGLDAAVYNLDHGSLDSELFRAVTIGLSVKNNPAKSQDLIALVGGAGVGFDKYWNFVSFQAGIVFGYENNYVVPYFNGKAFLSFPFNVREIHAESVLYLPPINTTGFDENIGLKIHLNRRSPWLPNVFIEVGFEQALKKLILSSLTNQSMMISLSLEFTHDFINKRVGGR
jgi:hypothetical protein